MSEKLKQIFSAMSSIEPPDDLFDKIMNRINIEKRIIVVRRRIILFSIIVAISGSALGFILPKAHNDLSISGSYAFFSLLFSDFDAVLKYWNNFILAFLESLPIISIIGFLGTAFLFFESLKIVIKDIKKTFILLKINRLTGLI